MIQPDGGKDTLDRQVPAQQQLFLILNMFKSMTLLVFVALAACVFAMDAEVQDQAAAEQYYRIHGVYPSWYQYGVNAFNGFRGYPFAGYPYPGYPITGYPSAVYPAAAASTVVKNVAYPYGYGYNTFQYGTYGAVPYVEPYVAPPHTSARRAADPGCGKDPNPECCYGSCG
ncbi:uncharacterized protein LOC124315935 [Daphnia pulicaria]|uniref:uncharacterized protein LOC124315935 n=1 Tax=Daphnia pulicaria TaxID=35523 RepID=UPI001EEB193A|nr:uncharacterized protein LOC124315935 [Daphnia pulicaria]XP_046637643.1 uncharacterized protein LOC124315935 [Daphnia pulicaria]